MATPFYLITMLRGIHIYIDRKGWVGGQLYVLIYKMNDIFSFTLQGRRKVSNIGWAQSSQDSKYWVGTTTTLLLIAKNIGWARAPVPPMFLQFCELISKVRFEFTA